MTTADIIIIGAGGHAGSVIDVINSTRNYRVVKLVDPKYKMAHGYSVLQVDEDFVKYCEQARIEWGAVGIGAVFNWEAKLRGIALLRSAGLTAPSIIASTAHVVSSAHLDCGTIVHHQAIVNTNAKIGEFVTINTGAIVEHDAQVGDYTHIAPGAIILGGAKIGKQCLIGAGVIVPPGKEIPSNTMLTVKQSLIEKNGDCKTDYIV